LMGVQVVFVFEKCGLVRSHRFVVRNGCARILCPPCGMSLGVCVHVLMWEGG
jgi:hypothetical protein